MDFKDQVTKWVENKFGKVISKELREKVAEENSPFDVETYANSLLDEHFGGNYAEQLNEIFNQDSYDDLISSEFEYFSEKQDGLNDSLEFQTFFEEEIISNLESNSREAKKKSLKILEASAEDFINRTSRNAIIESLQKTLTTRDREIYNLVLKIFQKLLRCSKKPQAVCNGFTSTAKLIAKQIVFLNLENETSSIEQTCGLKEVTRQCNIGSSEPDTSKHWKNPRSPNSANLEVLIKLMWLLVDCQQQMPVKWTRFNESRFREIIFSFVHLLSSTTIPENKKLSGLELLSVLNPTATWCRYYCHTAVGRSLLCSALKKYKTFFTHIVEIILEHINIKKSNRLPSIGDGKHSNKVSKKSKNDASEVPSPLNTITNVGHETEKRETRPKQKRLDDRNNWIRSAPVEQCGARTCEDGKTKKSKRPTSVWVVQGIPGRVVAEAVFCHSVSLVTWLIQFRSGQALFPVHLRTRKRLLSIQDLSLHLIDHLENDQNYERETAGIVFTSDYRDKLDEIAGILRNVKGRMSSSRSMDRQTFSNL